MIRRPRKIAAAATAAAVACVLFTGQITPAAVANAVDQAHGGTVSASSAPDAGTIATREKVASLAYPQNRAELNQLIKAAGIPASARAKLDRAIEHMSDAQVKGMLAASSRSDAGANLRGLVVAAIDPDDYRCESSPLSEYIASLLSEASLGELYATLILISVGAFDVQAYEALLYTHTRPNTFGQDNAYERPLKKTLRQAKRFWDVDTDDVILGAMDTELWQRIDGDSPEAKAALRRAATAWTTWVKMARGRDSDVDGREYDLDYGYEMVTGMDELFEQDGLMPYLQDGRNDLFTLNAFAFTAEGDPAAQKDPYLRNLSDRIIVGEGILNASMAFGLGRFGPRGIVAHEFMHQVQYENDVEFGAPDPSGQPAATRRTELMADAGASYFATHKRGLTLNAKRTAKIAASFYAVGDCNFDSAGHHGTPNQRRRASYWGSDLAAREQVQGHILPSATVIDRFDDALPTIVAPDAQ